MRILRKILNFWKVLVLFLCLEGSGGTVISELQAEPLRLQFPPNLPFQGAPQSKNPGYMLEILEAIFPEAGIPLKVFEAPLERSILNVQEGLFDAVLGVNPAEAPRLIFPEEELGTLADTFFVKQGYDWRFLGIDSLKSVRLGVIGGYTYGHELQRYLQDPASESRIIWGKGSNALSRLLEMQQLGRVDVLVSSLQVVRWTQQQLGLPEEELVARGSLGSAKKIYIAFSPQNPKSSTYAALFSQKLRLLRQSGALQKILTRYHQKDWKPRLQSDHPMKLIFAQSADPITLDPAVATDLRSFKAIENLYDGLVRYQDGSTKIEPALATTWNASVDKTTWTFHLRPGVFFHDGTPCDAEAVVHSFLRQIDPAHPSYQKEFANARFTFHHVQSVKALDKERVEIQLQSPYAPFLYNLAMPSARIVSPLALATSSRGLERVPVGTGPFRWVSWEKSRLVLAKNPHYWAGSPYLDQLEIRSYPAEQMLQAFAQGELKLISDFSHINARQIESRPNQMILLAPVMQVGYLAMNNAKKPWDQLKVRYALNHAVDKKKIIQEVYQGFASVSKTALPPSMWGHHEGISDFDYNPAQAKALLQEAGFPEGFETSLIYAPSPEREKLAAKLKEAFGQIGIKLITQVIPQGFFKRVRSGDYDLALVNWFGDNGDPDNFLYVLFDSDNTSPGAASNVAFFRHEGLDRLLLQAQQISETQARTLLYRQAQEIIRQQAPWVHLSHEVQVLAHTPEVHDLIAHPTGTVRFYRAWVE